MILTGEIKEIGVGTKVHHSRYIGRFIKQNGILKSFSNQPGYAFIVYKCNEEWEKYREYTGELTRLVDIKFGWAEPIK